MYETRTAGPASVVTYWHTFNKGRIRLELVSSPVRKFPRVTPVTWSEQLSLLREAWAQKGRMSVSVLTVGYINRSLEQLIGLLQDEQVRFLIDIRSSPVSRIKPEFS